MSEFLKNAWYVAAWSDEVSDKPRSIRILGEKICLFRNGSNQLVAFEDFCPHRRLPLSMGRIKGDLLECGYHGLTFDCEGKCVSAPTNDNNIPDKAQVNTYPLEERYGLIWIWMGNKALADSNDIFSVDHYGEAGWGYNRGPAIDVECHYLYINDNLLDPTHVAWVHTSSFGEANTKDTPLNLELSDTGVIVSRWMKNAEIAPFYKKVVPFDGLCDRLQHYEVRYPSHALIQAVFTPAGKGGEGYVVDQETFIMNSYNFMTPVDERNTRYYWFQLRNVEPDNEAVSQIMSDGVKSAFEEDRIILNALQKGIDEKPDDLIHLRSDAGGFQFRRRLNSLIKKESAS